MRMHAGGAHTSHHPQKSVMDTQNKALGLWNINFCSSKRTAVLVAKKIAEQQNSRTEVTAVR
jgi:hypothetical protein